ncbi:hypothetical protein SODG_003514 [Sodalis praecaptivus]
MRDALNSNIFGEPGWMGTGWRAARDLKRHDIGGKTGTTNDSKDAWFSGYGPDTITTVWIGFDDHRRNLGRTTASGAISDQISGAEGGAKSAQPIWDDYMKIALEGIPEEKQDPPRALLPSLSIRAAASCPTAAATAGRNTLSTAPSRKSGSCMKSVQH